MKTIKSKLLTFTVRGVSVEQIDGHELTHDEIESVKINLAIMHGVSYDEVELVMEDIETIPKSRVAAVNEQGQLIARADSIYGTWRVANGLRPSYDLTHQSLMNEWLTLITKKDFCKAIIFS